MIRRFACVLCILILVASVAISQDFQGTTVAPQLKQLDEFTLHSERHLVDDITPFGKTGTIRVVVEIPAGTNAKWEVDKKDGQLKWEFKNGKPRIVRFLPYPGNYGMVPRTVLPKQSGGDGDPLDVLVLGPAVPRGSVLDVKLVGVLKLLDDGEQDDKLLAVMPGTPLAEVDDLEALKKRFPGVLPIIELWLTSYKSPGEMQSRGFEDAGAARRILATAMQAYRKRAK
jgi:inorganic pyrophosphatase